MIWFQIALGFMVASTVTETTSVTVVGYDRTGVVLWNVDAEDQEDLAWLVVSEVMDQTFEVEWCLQDETSEISTCVSGRNFCTKTNYPHPKFCGIFECNLPFLGKYNCLCTPASCTCNGVAFGGKTCSV